MADINCTLIEIDNDNRAVICVGEDPDAGIVVTGPVRWIHWDVQQFATATDHYYFQTADQAVG